MRRLKSCFPLETGKWNSKIGALTLAGLLAFGGAASAFADENNEKVISSLQQQQTITVSGNVQDTQGMPVPGANIVIQGTTTGTITDMDGNYSLDAPENGTLVFSFIGFNTQVIPVEGRSTINVTLEEESLGLDEVVVTALGIKRETKKLGYGMTEVAGDEIASTNTVNPVQALQGKSTGLTIGASDGGLFGNSKIQIRGVSVMNSKNNQPIFVVDGVILDNNITDSSADWAASSNDFGNMLKNLNPDEYESVSVLKGAAATALYGSRGINGAVVITTKDGEGAKGIGVSVSQTVGIDHVYNTPDLQYEYGPGVMPGYIDYGEKDANDRYYRFDSQQFYLNSNGDPSFRSHPWGGGYGFGPKYDGRMVEHYDGEMRPYLPAKDNMLDAYDLGINSNTSVALKGGNEDGNFYLSHSYNYRNGTLPKNTFSRNATKFSGSYNLASWLRAEASISFTTSTPKNPQNDLAQQFATGGLNNLYDTERWKEREIYQASHGGVPSSAYGDKYAYVPGNSIWFSYNMNENVRKEQVTRPIVRLTADLSDWVSITAEGNMNHYTMEHELKQLGQGYANEGGYYELKHDRNVSRTGKLVANINGDITEDISTSVMLGGEIFDQEMSMTRAWTDGGLIVPGKFFLDNSKKTKLSEGRVYGTKQINSLYFLANFGWRDQLFLDITGRNDWSSSLVYTDGTGNYSYFYPSVSSSWIFTESFDTPAWMTFGKVRLSWAQVGNDTDPYNINKGYSVGNHQINESSFAYYNTRSTTSVDPDIKPERKNSFEAGLDLRMLQNRVGLDVTYYDETIENQIGNVPIPYESGVNELLTNVGTLNNSGLEISLKLTPVKTSNFNWTTTFNYWDNTTKITELHEDYGAYRVLGGYVDYGNFRIGSVAYEGGEYGVLMSDSKPKVWQSEDANDPRNGMKVLTWRDDWRGAYYTRSYEVEEVGKMQPDFEGSWDNSFSFKGLTLSVLLDARYGGHLASYANRYGTAYGWLETSLAGRDPQHGGVEWTSEYSDTEGRTYSDGVIPDGVFQEGQTVTAPNGSTVDVGGMTYQEAFDAGYVEPTHAGTHTYFNNSWGSGVVNDDWFEEVKYIALRNISVGYNLPKSIAQSIKAQNLYLAFNARNLGYLYNSMPNNLNPEGFRGTTSTESFLERSFMPYTASYTFTVKVDF
ncbi:iron complex outermembrane receptor protein [Marinilabilia salmonicolor]|jgi:iron complex outermembrane receptor protein|uniref:SusC/RagA family TonB-linked outer membrane protein n=1 Tax=Marinilabilia salmonicolor TaxID=989 RepID=UPI000D05B3F4|nr:SusC/RagA family TonB-linked outer membrane protein [Marinilabilia salmonicolor]PRZ01615.1 iron complex outermembrane receptor protein [Marinilabilia salmonicolor]